MRNTHASSIVHQHLIDKIPQYFISLPQKLASLEFKLFKLPPDFAAKSNQLSIIKSNQIIKSTIARDLLFMFVFNYCAFPSHVSFSKWKMVVRKVQVK